MIRQKTNAQLYCWLCNEYLWNNKMSKLLALIQLIPGLKVGQTGCHWDSLSSYFRFFQLCTELPWLQSEIFVNMIVKSGKHRMFFSITRMFQYATSSRNVSFKIWPSNKFENTLFSAMAITKYAWSKCYEYVLAMFLRMRTTLMEQSLLSCFILSHH